MFIAGRFKRPFFGCKNWQIERVVQSGLPFLDKGKFKAAKIRSASKKRDWGPCEQVLMFAPEAEGKFRLDQAIIGELVVLASATVLTVENMMKSRPNIEFGLKTGDVCKAQVHTVGQEEILEEKLV